MGCALGLTGLVPVESLRLSWPSPAAGIVELELAPFCEEVAIQGTVNDDHHQYTHQHIYIISICLESGRHEGVTAKKRKHEGATTKEGDSRRAFPYLSHDQTWTVSMRT